MQQTGQFTIPASHPSLPGHFPGRPVVPGVVLLEEVLACLPPGLTLLTAKFTSPVQAQETVCVASTARQDGKVHFAAHVGDRAVLHGVAGPTA